MSNFEFTTNWFELNGKQVWDALLPQLNPLKVLEIGSYEGESTCYLINYLSKKENTELYCIDNWTGAIEQINRNIDMKEVENRFDNNVKKAMMDKPNKIKFVKLKGNSDFYLSKLLTQNKSNYFEDLAIILKMPKWIFIKALFRK